MAAAVPTTTKITTRCGGMKVRRYYWSGEPTQWRTLIVSDRVFC